MKITAATRTVTGEITIVLSVAEAEELTDTLAFVEQLWRALERRTVDNRLHDRLAAIVDRERLGTVLDRESRGDKL